MHQSVHEETVGDDTWYVWTDGDGTEHYFKIEDNPPYHDEDGLRLKLTYTSTTVTITDMQDNVMTFTKETGWEKYWLTETKDALQNAVTVTYLAERKIDRVTDPVGRYVQQYTYTNDRLSSLSVRKADGTDAGYPGCGFTYTNGNLTGVTYTDLTSGQQTTYTYESGSHLLTGMANYDGLTVTAAYEADTDDEKKRAVSLEQTSGGVASTKMLFEYSHQSTKVTFVEQAGDNNSNTTSSSDHELFYQFNERGNITSVRDSAGYATYKTYDAEHPNYPDVASRLQRTNVNLLINHGFEKTTGTTNWATAKLDGATGTHSYATDKKKQGTYSAKMLRTNSAGRMTISQDVTVTRGETYTFSGYVRTSADTVQGRAAVLLGSVTLSEGLAVTSVDEWTRIHATFTVPTAANETMATVTVRFEAIGGSGSAWFDCAQLEYGETANRYNMLENGCFERVNADNTPANWTAKSENSATEIVVDLPLPD